MQFEELSAALLEPNWPDAGDSRTALLIELKRDAVIPIPEEVCAWLQAQPVPVIGYKPDPEPHPLDDGVDTIVQDEATLQHCINAINAHPNAAAVLTQVVRTTTQLPVSAALSVESLGYATLQSGTEFQSWLTTRPTPRESLAASPIETDRRGEVLYICLTDPASRNAMSVSMRDALCEAFKLAVMDDDIKEVIVTGRGPSFCAGGDLREFGLATDYSQAHRIRQTRIPAQHIARASEKFCFYLQGGCVGAGIEMPAFAQTLVADPDAFFQLPEVGFGLIPGAGGCVSIPRRIGKHRMIELALTGRKLSAPEALDWGLIDRLEPQQNWSTQYD